MDTHESYVSLETARLAKQAGFDWKITACLTEQKGTLILTSDYCNYNDGLIPGLISAPTQAVLQKWLREVKELNVNVDTWPGALWRWVVWKIDPERRIVASEHSNYKTYEAALEAGLQACLEKIVY